VLKPAVGGGVAWIDRRASLLFLGAVKNEFDPRGETPTLSKILNRQLCTTVWPAAGGPLAESCSRSLYGVTVIFAALGVCGTRNPSRYPWICGVFFQWDYFSSPEFASISRRASSPGIRLAKNQF
jgi:hypothetical protein